MVSLGRCHQKILVGGGCNIKGAEVESGINAYDTWRITSSKPFNVNQLLVCGKSTHRHWSSLHWSHICLWGWCILAHVHYFSQYIYRRNARWERRIFLFMDFPSTCLQFLGKSQLDCALITPPRIFSTSARACVGGFVSAAVFNSFSVLGLLLLNGLLPLEFPWGFNSMGCSRWSNLYCTKALRWQCPWWSEKNIYTKVTNVKLNICSAI